MDPTEEKITTQDIVDVFERSFSNSYPFETIFSDWVEAMSIAFQNVLDNPIKDKREKRYQEIMKRYSKEEQTILSGTLVGMLAITLTQEMRDVLGEIYMLGSGNKKTGQFFTPFNLSELTASCLATDIPEEKILLNEPSCGSCGMVIAFCKNLKSQGYNYQNKVKVVAQDIDWRCVYMSYVQMELLGIDAVVFQGDTLQDSKASEEQIFRTMRNRGFIYG